MPRPAPCDLHQRTVALDDGVVKMVLQQANYDHGQETHNLHRRRGELSSDADVDPAMTHVQRLLAAAWSTALVVAAAAPAHAIQFGLKDGPGAKFNDDDFALMMARVDTALKSPTEGEVLEWKSDKTPASGSVVPMNKLTSNGLPCRRLRITNVYGEQKAQGVYKFCEKPAGKWKLVGPDKE
jgi:surface antigen